MYGLIKSGPTALCRLSFVRMSMMFCSVNTRMPNRLGGVFMSQYGGDVSSVFMTDAKYVFKVSVIVTGLVIFSPSTIKHSMLELGFVKFLVCYRRFLDFYYFFLLIFPHIVTWHDLCPCGIVLS